MRYRQESCCLAGYPARENRQRRTCSVNIFLLPWPQAKPAADLAKDEALGLRPGLPENRAIDHKAPEPQSPDTT